jgi:hypothetical protein
MQNGIVTNWVTNNTNVKYHAPLAENQSGSGLIRRSESVAS